jgi:hypothetical protein
VFFLFDVDNTLLGNDHVQRDLGNNLSWQYRLGAHSRYWALFKGLRTQLGYAV